MAWPPATHQDVQDEITAVKAALVPRGDQHARNDFDTLNAGALRTFHAALANRHFGTCDIAVTGTSISQGGGATKIANRWVNRLLDLIRYRFPVSGITGGLGFVPFNFPVISAFSDNPFTQSGGFQNDGYGLARRAVTLSSAGDKVTGTFTGTALDIWYVRYSVGGTFSVAIDGGAAANVITSGSESVTDGLRYQVTGLTPGAHTVTIAYVSGGTVFLGGATIYNGDETKGIRLWAGGHASTQSAYWSDADNLHWLDTVATVQPALHILEVVTNDYGQNPTVDPATAKTNVQAIIAKIRAVASPSIVLLATWDRSLSGVTPPATWADYVNALYDVAAADGNIAVADAYRWFGTGAPPGNGLIADNVHPSDKGHAFLADHLAQFLLPR